MNQRQEKIMQILMETSDWMKGKDLAALLKVTPRTIRSDIEALRSSLPSDAIESHSQKGYRILPGKISDLNHANEPSSLPQSPAARRNYIMKLLISEKEVNISYLPAELYVSPYTIDGDIRHIRTHLEDGGKLILRSGKNRIWIEGDELEKRRLYKELLSSEVEENFLNLDKISALYTEFDLLEVKDILLAALEKHGCRLRDTSANIVYMHVGISLQRLMHFHPMTDFEADSSICKTAEYESAKDFFDQMSRRYRIEVPEAEIEHLALLLMGKGSLAYAGADIDYNGHTIRTMVLISEILERIASEFGVDFSDDHDLVGGLDLHMRGLLTRSLQGTAAQNIYLDEIRWKFPLVFEMGVSAAGMIQQKTGIVLDQNEIGFLALHFGTAYTRKNRRQLYRALVIFPHDGAGALLSVNRLIRQFSERMEVVANLDAFEEKKVRYYHPDLILTSLPIGHSLNIPTVNVSLFYSPEDESILFQTLNMLDRARGRRLFESRIQNLIRKEFFHPLLKAGSVSEVIEKMCAPLQEKGYIPAGYADAVMEREKFSATSFVHGFALPHALQTDALESVISIAFLEKPVRWGSFDVDFVLMLAVRDEDRDLLSVFFDWWIQIVSSPVKFNNLKSQRNYQDFLNVILEEE
ncbi:BglG family transcription antiterminator [Ileibacterium valens]|uniref:BglG family transcription antiterminator n=2 Tax=Ileibacterium valens TaxID=1862668 RepID=UPI00259B8E13|nr:PRD domain-containing protein [Ileibacterium valens]